MLWNKVIYEAVKTVQQATQHGAYDTPKVAIFGALTRNVYGDLLFTYR